VTRRQLAYFALVQAVMFFALAFGGYGYTNYVDHKRVQGERAAALERQRQSEITLKVICDMATAQEDVFRDSTGQIGLKAFNAWQALATQFHCE